MSNKLLHSTRVCFVRRCFQDYSGIFVPRVCKETSTRLLKPPRYGLYETKVIQKIVRHLDQNGVVKENDGPWAALVVISIKQHQ